MCRYCSFDLYTHYLINGDLSLSDNLDIGITNGESLEDLPIINIIATEAHQSSYKIDEVFDDEIEGEIKYEAVLANGEELPEWITLDSNTGEFIVEPGTEENGTYEIIVRTTNSWGEDLTSLVALQIVSEAEKESLITEDSNTIILDSTELETNTSPQETNSQPQISINDVQVTDSSAGRELTFTVSLDIAGSEIITVDYNTADNTAIEGEDYLAANGTLTFAPGETSKTVTVNTTGTSYLDDDETFLVNLSNPTNATIQDSEALGTIIPAHAGLRRWSFSKETVTFSFFDESVFGQGGYDGGSAESNAREVSEVVKASYRQIFEHLNTFVDRQFVEVAESESAVGDIRILVSDAPSYAYAYYGGDIHLTEWAAASDAGINGWESVPGVYAYAALLHELGHSLGMPHSFGRDTSLFDPEENSSNTVMSYTFPGNHPGTFMAYDIKSLQERYGAAEYRPEDTVYEFLTVDNYTVDGELAIDTPSRLKQTIWDSGGIDTFDFSQLAFDNSGYRFDLNQSKYQTTQNAYQGSSYTRNEVKYYVPKYGTSIAIDVEIENIINSSSDDIIIGNPIGNLFGGYLPELTTGSDLLIDTNNLDTLDLSGFALSELELIQINNDLQIDLGAENFVTVEGYYALAENERINILYKPEDVLLAVEPPVASIEDIVVNEADNTTNAQVTIRLDKAVRGAFNVSYFTLDNTAIAGEDYIAVNNTVTFNPGEISKTVNIPIIGDSLNESNETFYFSTGDKQAEITINDDDSATLPQINIQDAGVLSNIPIRDSNNNLKNTTGLLFKITLDIPSDRTVEVDYATADGTAIAGEDYTAKNKTLTFQPGETVKQVFVPITIDDISEADENLYLNLTNPVNAIVADNQAIGTIEETRSLSVSDVTVSEDGTEALFTISLDRPSVHTAIASYYTEDGTAQAGSDYTSSSGRFGILPGESSITIAVPLIDNNLTEAAETFFLNLSSPKYVLIDDSQGQATITNDDPIPTQNPGGIYQNLKLWLKADSGITTNNGEVTTWTDNSQLAVEYTPNDVAERPVLATDEFNFNPSISFDGNDALTTTRTNFDGGEVFFVLKGQDNGGSSSLLSDSNYYYKSDFKYEQWWNKGKLGFTRKGIADYTSNIDSPNNQLSLLSFNTDIDSNIVNLAVENNGVLSQDSLDIGASNSIAIEYLAQSFKGEIAEVVVFDRVLSDTERLQLRSSLAIKYGLALDLNSDYLNSDNQIWWNANLAGNYNNDIAGIAKDFSADLAQVKSRSSNDDAIITITAEDTTDGLEDGEALIWGNNNSPVLSDRIWQVQESQGDVGTVSISFDLSKLGEVQPIEKYALQIGNNASFDASQFYTVGRNLENNTLTFTGVDFNNGEYFRLNSQFEGEEAKLLIGNEQNNLLDGGWGNDTLRGKEGNDQLYGWAGDDTLIGGEGDDTIDGGSGIDYLYESGDLDFNLANNRLTGNGTDTLSNLEFVILKGGAGNNSIETTSTTQIKTKFQGGLGNDTLRGGLNNDTLNGEDGDDILVGRDGNDVLDGGDGIDLLYESGDRDFTLTNSRLTGNGTDIIKNLEFVHLTGGDGNNYIEATSNVQIKTKFKGEAGNDTLRGGLNDDTLIGGDGDDVLIGRNGNDILDGGNGIDRLYESTDNNFILTDSRLIGNDTDLIKNLEFINLAGGNGNNLIDASQSTLAKITIKGGDGNDTLIGSQIGDNIQGGNGEDLIYGNGGNNILYGNNGSDIFVLESHDGTITVKDFEDGSDRFGLSNSLNFSDLYFVANSNGVSIRDLTNNNALLADVVGADLADLTSDDFIAV